MSYMEKRAFERIPTNLHARFFHNRILYEGIVSDFSKNGMYMKTSMCLPCETKLEILIPLIEEVLKVPVEVVRAVFTYNICEGMGIKLLEQPKKYLKLADSLRSALEH